MSFFVKACCQALKEFPAVNTQVEGDDIIYQHFYDIGVAMSIESGLIVPVHPGRGLAELRRDRGGDCRPRETGPGEETPAG